MKNDWNFFDLKVAKSTEYTTINLVGRTGLENVAQMTAIVPDLSKQDAQHVVVNCEHLNELSPHWIRALLQLNQKLKSIKKQLCLIHVSAAVKKVLRQEGVEDSLNVHDTLQAAMLSIGLNTPKVLDVNFINPFLIATVKVLETQTSTKAKSGQIYKRAANEKYLGDISGVIGLVSDAFSGSVVISYPEATFLKIMSRMLGEEYTTITKDIEDGAGELTNIIFGQAKVLLNEQGFGIKTAIPSVVSGRDHTVLSLSTGPRVVVPFETDAGPFFIEIVTSS